MKRGRARVPEHGDDMLRHEARVLEGALDDRRIAVTDDRVNLLGTGADGKHHLLVHGAPSKLLQQAPPAFPHAPADGVDHRAVPHPLHQTAQASLVVGRGVEEPDAHAGRAGGVVGGRDDMDHLGAQGERLLELGDPELEAAPGSRRTALLGREKNAAFAEVEREFPDREPLDRECREDRHHLSIANVARIGTTTRMVRSSGIDSGSPMEIPSSEI